MAAMGGGLIVTFLLQYIAALSRRNCVPIVLAMTIKRKIDQITTSQFV